MLSKKYKYKKSCKQKGGSRYAVKNQSQQTKNTNSKVTPLMLIKMRIAAIIILLKKIQQILIAKFNNNNNNHNKKIKRLVLQNLYHLYELISIYNTNMQTNKNTFISYLNKNNITSIYKQLKILITTLENMLKPENSYMLNYATYSQFEPFVERFSQIINISLKETIPDIHYTKIKSNLVMLYNKPIKLEDYNVTESNSDGPNKRMPNESNGSLGRSGNLTNNSGVNNNTASLLPQN